LTPKNAAPLLPH